MGFVAAPLVGLGFLVAAVLVFRSGRRWRRRARPAEGRIVDREWDRDDGYYPVFEFSTWRGETVRVRSNLHTSLQRLDIGDQVPVLYNRDRPEDARIDTRVFRYSGPAILAAIGVGVIVVWAALSFAAPST